MEADQDNEFTTHTIRCRLLGPGDEQRSQGREPPLPDDNHDDVFFKCLDGGGESITTRAIKPGPARRFDAHHSMNDSIQGSNERPTLDKCNSWREMSCFDGEAHDENRAEQMGAQYDLKQTRPAFGSPRPINGGQFDAEPNDG